MSVPNVPTTSGHNSRAYLSILKRTAFFRELPDELMGEILQVARVREVPKGTQVLTVGRNCNAIFVVLSGTLRVYLPHSYERPLVLNLVGQGEMLGEICAADSQGHTASVDAIEASQLLHWNLTDLNVFKTRLSSVHAAWERLLAWRVREINARQIARANGTVAARLSRLLAEFAERYHPEELSRPNVICQGNENRSNLFKSLVTSCDVATDVATVPVTIPMRLRQEDLSCLISASRYRVNECLGHFAMQGWVRQEPQLRLTVLDLRALRNLPKDM